MSDAPLGHHLLTSTSIEISDTLLTGHHHTVLLTNKTLCSQGDSNTQKTGTSVVQEGQPAMQVLSAIL